MKLKNIIRKIKSLDSIYYLVGFLLTVCLAMFLYMTINTTPRADDYCLAVRIDDMGKLNTYKYYRENWYGRYSSSIIRIILYIRPLWLRVYGPYMFFLSIIFVSIIIFSVNWLLDTSKSIKVLISLIFITIYLTLVPNISQTFFWFPAGISSMLPAFITIPHLINLLNYTTRSNSKSIVLAMLTTIYLIGSNEVFLVSTLVLNLGFGIYFIAKKRSFDLRVTLLLFTTLICMAYFISAPGIQHRLDAFSKNNQSVSMALYNSLFWTLDFLNRYLYGNLTVILGLSLVFIITKYRYIKLRVNLNPYVIFIVTTLFLVLSSFVAYYSVGNRPFKRTENAILLIFLVLLTAFSVSFAELYVNKKRKRVATDSYTVAALFILVLSSINFTPFWNLYEDITVALPEYNVKLSSRMKKIEEYKNLSGEIKPEILELEIIKEFPSVFQTSDISTDPDNWGNECFAQYHYVGKVRGVK